MVLALVVLSCKDNDTIYLVELPNPNGDTIIVGNDTIVNGDTINSNGNDNTLECKDPVIGIELLVAEPVDAKFYAIGRRLVLVCQNPNKLISINVATFASEKKPQHDQFRFQGPQRTGLEVQW